MTKPLSDNIAASDQKNRAASGSRSGLIARGESGPAFCHPCSGPGRFLLFVRFHRNLLVPTARSSGGVVGLLPVRSISMVITDGAF